MRNVYLMAILVALVGFSLSGCDVNVKGECQSPEHEPAPARDVNLALGHLDGNGVIQPLLSQKDLIAQFAGIPRGPIHSVDFLFVENKPYMRGYGQGFRIFMQLFVDLKEGNLYRLNNEYDECSGTCLCDYIGGSLCDCTESGIEDDCKYDSGKD